MTPLGNYVLKSVKGRNQLEPTIFVCTNWKLICSIAKLDPVPKLHVIAQMKPDQAVPGDTAAMFIDPTTGDVCVNKTDLETDCMAFTIGDMNPLGILWAMPSVMVRATLIRRMEISAVQRLDLSVARRAGWPEELIKVNENVVGNDLRSERAKKMGDLLMIQAAVQNYIQYLAIDAEVDTARLKSIIWSEMHKLDLDLFRVTPREK